MKEKQIFFDQSTGMSKFLLVMAAAKRSKQINFMAKERGLPPNQVANIKTKYIKPPTIALREIMEGKVVNYYKSEEEKTEPADSLPSEESSQEANVSA